ncbi:uncharacterized protein DUF2528 [Volucribacter psittacicida]|uniref:Uncharacterized protein DUF2528 n=1 Tax=Volucribacter psittacicida TaxID=203482 RepID=A0A4V2PB34_9PAST|nr:DUF2528 family protein [Volucribacter psittacicida]TCJ95935.1 uncharacterized protein DUF2528 [Volucribacter psittacicida]
MIELNTIGKQLITISTDDWCDVEAEIKVVIDFEHPKFKEALITMSAFWYGCPSENASIEEHLEFFLPILGSRIYYLAQDYGQNQIIDQMKGEEGYYPLDGSYGILFHSYSVPDIDSDDFEIVEMKPFLDKD